MSNCCLVFSAVINQSELEYGNFLSALALNVPPERVLEIPCEIKRQVLSN